MAPNPFLSGSNVTHTGSSKSSSVLDVTPDMPENLAEVSYADIQQAWQAYNNSPIAHTIHQLEYVLENPNYTLAPWEVNALAKVFEKFHAKYTSPLAKALK